MSASADVAVTGHETKYARTVQLRYNYRLYPTLGQQVALARAFGCARVVFNDGLRARQEAFAAGLPYISDAELSARLTAMKKTLERAWLTEVSSVVLQQALVDLNAAYRNFFASVSGTRKGPKIAPPRFRSRKDRRQAIRFTSNARRFEPTSQMCSACGVKDGPKPLHVRIWQCQGCGVSQDRDVNAAVNVARAAGLAVTACGAQARPGPALAQRGEAGTHPKPRREPV